MLRKMILVVASCAAIGATALAPTSASAAWHGGWGGHGGWGWHRAFVVHPVVGPVYAGPVYGSCWARRWVPTPYGPTFRWVNRCY